MEENKVLEHHFVEDPEGNALKFYVDYDFEMWKYDEDNRVKLDIRPINVPRLLKEVSNENGKVYLMKRN